MTELFDITDTIAKRRIREELQKKREKAEKSLEIQTAILNLNSKAVRERGSLKHLMGLLSIIKKVNSIYN